MQIQRSLNTDIPSRISELQAMMKEFILKHKLYRILLRGKGLEFETFRTYAPDDDASTIDWKASKRANNLLVKQYRDERNLKIIFIVDVGENMIFGSSEKLKCEYSAEVVASFSHLIITTGDRVGSIIFSDKIKHYLGPAGGTRKFYQFVDILTDPETYGGASRLSNGLEFALSYLNKNIDSVVIVSDFTEFDESLVKPLTIISERFETLVLAINDPLDKSLPLFSGEIAIQDPRTGEQMLIDPRVAKATYERIAAEKEALLKSTCSKHNIDYLPLMTNVPFVPTLAEFLKARIKKEETR
ncbi:DUF58 domain-containing protein [Candidatus Pacearchaeota archaeon]|nr:DUF58 domain-containing protein [Candidatus Pacearchaeota archaeon]